MANLRELAETNAWVAYEELGQSHPNYDKIIENLTWALRNACEAKAEANNKTEPR